MFGMPKPTEHALARLRNPSHTSVEDGMPAASAATLARNTAGVQLPQQPIPEIIASTLSSLKRRASDPTTSRSSLPWVLPNSL
jgi:hypothetical protein